MHMVSTQSFFFFYLVKNVLIPVNSGPSDPSLLDARLYRRAVTRPHLHVPNPYISFVVTLTSPLGLPSALFSLVELINSVFTVELINSQPLNQSINK
jgi:hypothetical protein